MTMMHHGIVEFILTLNRCICLPVHSDSIADISCPKVRHTEQKYRIMFLLNERPRVAPNELTKQRCAQHELRGPRRQQN
jgi:hypothetical protein